VGVSGGKHHAAARGVSGSPRFPLWDLHPSECSWISPLTTRRLFPIFEAQAGHAVEFRGSVRDESQVVREGDGGDHQIVRTDGCAAAGQLGAQSAIGFGAWSSNGKDSKESRKARC